MHAYEDLIVTTVSINYLDLTLNWIENLKKFNLIDNILIFCIDKLIYNELKNKVSCILVNNMLEITSRGDWIEAEKKYKCIAPINYAKANPVNLLVSDVDTIFLKNPLKEFKERCKDVDIVTTSDKRYDAFHLQRQKSKIVTVEKNKIIDWGFTDQHKYGEINGSVGYFKYSSYIIKAFEKMFSEKTVLKYPTKIEKGAAQTIFNKEVKKTNIKIKVLSVFEFANGSLLNVDYLKKKVVDSAIGIHYNFCNPDPHIGYIEKVNKIKKDGYWFI
jgi:hypothetical protein